MTTRRCHKKFNSCHRNKYYDSSDSSINYFFFNSTNKKRRFKKNINVNISFFRKKKQKKNINVNSIMIFFSNSNMLRLFRSLVHEFIRIFLMLFRQAVLSKWKITLLKLSTTSLIEKSIKIWNWETQKKSKSTKRLIEYSNKKNSIYKLYSSKNAFSKSSSDENITTLNLTSTSYSLATQKTMKFIFKKNQLDVFTSYIEINEIKSKKIKTIVTHEMRNKCLIFYFSLIALIFIHVKNTIISHQF